MRMPMKTWAVFSDSFKASVRDLVVVGGRVLERAAVGSEQLLHDLIHRDIVGEAVLEASCNRAGLTCS